MSDILPGYTVTFKRQEAPSLLLIILRQMVNTLSVKLAMKKKD